MTRRWGYRLPPADAPMSAINISKFSQAKLVAKLPTYLGFNANKDLLTSFSLNQYVQQI